MKKLFILGVLFFPINKIKAQKQFYPGIKAGGSLVNWVGDNTEQAKLRVSYVAGIYGSFKLTRQFIVQPEVLYSSTGPGFSGGKYDITYLNIPVIFKYQTLGGFYGETGPQVSYLLKAQFKNGGEKTNVKEFIKSQDFSWAFGIGYKLKSGLEIGARQVAGISKIGSSEGNSFKNSMFSLGLAYTFGNK